MCVHVKELIQVGIEKGREKLSMEAVTCRKAREINSIMSQNWTLFWWVVSTHMTHNVFLFFKKAKITKPVPILCVLYQYAFSPMCQRDSERCLFKGKGTYIYGVYTYVTVFVYHVIFILYHTKQCHS